jgi:hypothetical protein
MSTLCVPALQRFVGPRNPAISEIFFHATQTEVQAVNVITRTQIYKPVVHSRVSRAGSWDSLGFGLGYKVLLTYFLQ